MGGDPHRGKGPQASCPLHTWTPGPMLTYRRVHIQVLHLLLKLIHHRRDLLQVHGAERAVQGFGHLCHVLRHLPQGGVRRQQGCRKERLPPPRGWACERPGPASPQRMSPPMKDGDGETQAPERQRCAARCGAALRSGGNPSVTSAPASPTARAGPPGTHPLHGHGRLHLGGHRIHAGRHAQPVHTLILLANGVLGVHPRTLHVLLLKGLSSGETPLGPGPGLAWAPSASAGHARSASAPRTRPRRGAAPKDGPEGTAASLPSPAPPEARSPRSTGEPERGEPMQATLVPRVRTTGAAGASLLLWAPIRCGGPAATPAPKPL